VTAYRAEIEIGVRGQERLNRLQNQISQLANQITRVNDESIFDPVAPRAIQSIENYSNAVSVAAANLRAAALGTQEETNAVRQYVQALGEANAARSRQNSLIAQEVANRRTVRPGDAGLGQQTPALPPALVKQQGIKEAWRTFFQEAAELATDLRVDAAAKGLNIQTSWNTFFTEAADLANDLKTNAAAKRINTQTSWNTFFTEAADLATDLKTNTAAKRLNIQNSWNSFFTEAADLATDLKTGAAAKRLAIQTSWNTFFTEAADLATDLKTNTAAKRLNIQNSWNSFFEDAAAVANDLQRQAEDTRRRIQNAGFGVQGPELPPKTTGPSSPIGGRFDIPGSPAFKQARLQGVALGAGFPLLFGGGPGAVLGGAAGGLVGGPAGFAAQIALSAIGTQLDKFAQQAIEMGTAINSTAGALELMREKSLFSSEAVAERAYQLEEQGKVEELAALLTEDLARAVGNEGVRALQDLGAETTETTRLWSLLTAQLNVLIAGPLTSFLQLVNQVLGEITAGQQIASLKKDLAPADLKRLQQRERELGTVKGGRIASELGTESIVLTPEAQQKILKEFGGLRKTIPSIPITQQDRRDITAPKPKKDRAAADAAREAERVAKALIQQRAITLEIQRQSEFSGKIAAAELAKDPVLVRRLQGEQKLTELGVQTAKQLELEKNSSVQLAIARTAQAKADLIRKETAQDIAEIEQQRQEKFADVLAGLEYQIEYENAVTREKRNQLELDEKARKLKKDGFTPKEIATLIGLEKGIQKQQEPLAKFIRDSEEELKDLQQVAVNVSQGIGNAIANSMSQGIVGLIEGTKTAQQIFADFLKSVGDVLIQEGTRMIAVYIAIGIAKAFAGLGGKGGGAETNTQFMERTGNLDLVGDSYKGLQGFATGGFVTSPTSAVVGEGGEPEYIIPASKMRGAMSRYAAGARGSSVIPGSGEQAAGGMGGDTANAAPIDVRYTVERINSVDYVTADQFRAGMAQAAQQGATQGERRALRTLQNSAATRGRIGV